MVFKKVELPFGVQTSLRELTTLGIKNAENLAIPSVRNDVRFLHSTTRIIKNLLMF